MVRGAQPHGLGTVARRRDDAEVGLRRQQRAETRADHLLVVDHHDADHGAPARSSGRVASTRNPPASPDSTATDSTDHGGSLAHPEQAMPGRGVAVGWHARTVVPDPHVERGVGVVELDVHGRARRVAPRVGQRLLDDPVGRELQARLQRDDLAGHDEPGAGATGGVARSVDQVDKVAQPRLWCSHGDRVGVLPQHAEQPSHLAEGLTCGLADGGQPLRALGWHARRRQPGRLGLDRDHRDVVGDHVVELAGDPGPLPTGGVLEQAPGEVLLGLAACGGLGSGPRRGADDPGEGRQREQDGDGRLVATGRSQGKARRTAQGTSSSSQ